VFTLQNNLALHVYHQTFTAEIPLPRLNVPLMSKPIGV